MRLVLDPKTHVIALVRDRPVRRLTREPAPVTHRSGHRRASAGRHSWCGPDQRSRAHPSRSDEGPVIVWSFWVLHCGDERVLARLLLLGQVTRAYQVMERLTTYILMCVGFLAQFHARR